MASTLTFPGVYIEEIPSGVRTITGVSTSVGLFIGRAIQGPLNKPTLCLSFTDYSRIFGTDTSLGELTQSVRLFFENGGTRCYIMRIAHNATAAKVKLQSEAGADVLDLTAKNAGMNGETIRAVVTYNGQQPEVTFNLELFRWGTVGGALVKQDRELWSNLSMDPLAARYAPSFLSQNSALVDAVSIVAAPGSGSGSSQSGRSVPHDSGTPTTFRTAWAALLGNVINGAYNPSQTLNGAINGAVTAIISSGTAIQNNDVIVIDSEQMLVTAGGGTTNLTVQRGVNGTTAVPHSDVSAISRRVAGNRFRISVDGMPYVDIDLAGLNVAGITAASVAASQTALAALIKGAIDPALPLGKTVAVDFVAGPTPPVADGNATSMLRISSTTGDVFIQPAGSNDLAVPLMLGTGQGGLEVSRYAAERPAPNAITLKTSALVAFAGRVQNAFNTITVDGSAIALGTTLQTVDSASRMYKDGYASSRTGNNDGVREKLALLQTAVNNFAAGNPTFRWRAEVWGARLALLPTNGSDNSIGTITTAATDIGGDFTKNVARYSVGAGGTAGLQVPAGSPATDGDAPTLNDYADAYIAIDKAVDLFNLLILPRDFAHSSATTTNLWGPASTFCAQRRAVLLMDAPDEWKTVQTATSPTTGVNSLRVGLVKDHAALFYPRLLVNDNGIRKAVGPSGAIAGLMARIDSTRGVWKAPAGTEADLRGVVGLELVFSDGENGVLNPRGINTLRSFPSGIVNWGARTMDGDDDFGSEWKYIPVRRLALFIEESLYRGTQWVVFEPNDEPLWSQIRLNIGAFMNNLFRQSAFQGKTPREAYFVKCDSETTTQNDINLGIVNILVGFAPLKPAEFVVIKLQQIAGQIQV